ncbi:MAG: 2-isopropylmalate synthase, partial [Nitrospirae bacterium]
LILGKHSGRHAFKERLRELGYELSQEELDKAFERFKKICDQKKYIFDEDLEVLVSEEVKKVPEVFSLVSLKVHSGTESKPTSTVVMIIRGERKETTETGDGPVDATYRAIAKLTETTSSLEKFEVKGITGGTDALGEVMVTLEQDGRTVRGNGSDTDIIVAAAKAYINALNKLEIRKRVPTKGV